MQTARRALLVLLTLGLVLAMIAPMALAQKEQDLLEEILRRKEVRVGVMLIVPPLGFRNERNEPDGFDVQIAKKMADALGVKLTLVEVLAANRIPYLLSGRVDVIIGAFSRTTERTKVIDFTFPYVMTGPVIMTHKDSGIKSVGDLDGKRVAVVKGTTGALWTKKLAPNAKILEYDTEPDTLLALKQRKVDALVNDDTILSGYKKENPELEMYGPPFYRDFLAFGVPKGQHNWRRWLNSFIFDLFNQGEIDELWPKYFNYPRPKFEITPMF